MELLHIEPTDKSPEVYMDPEGRIRINGRGLVVNKTDVPDMINDWLDTYIMDPAEITYVTIAFEYLNSFSTSYLLTYLKKISQVLIQSKKLKVQWFYEEDDEDMFERGEYIALSLNIPIEFIITNKLSDM
jgi:hypothetical protein